MDFSKTVFVSDLDGTLLTSEKTVNALDFEAIRRYRSAGGIFVAATGRPLHTVTDFFDVLGTESPMILCNGGIIYDPCKGKVLYEVDLPESAKMIMTDVRSRYINISPEIYTFSKRYYFHMNTVEKWHQHILGIDFIKVDDPDSISEPWNKMLFADEIEVINELSEFVKKYEGFGVRFVRSFPKFLEILPEGVSKGSALKKLIEIAGYEGRIVCAAGDYDNDIEMLKAADMSFCPADSQECVKNICSVTLKNTSNTGAIAEAIDFLERF